MKTWQRLVLAGWGLLLPFTVTGPTTAQDETAEASVVAQAFRTINVRSGPSTRFEVMTQMNPGDVMPVVGRSDEGNNWLLIQIDGMTGWVAYFTVTVVGDPDTLPVIAPDEALDVTTPLELPTQVQLRQAESDYYATAYRRVNVRNGPGTGFDVIGVLVPGDTVDIVGASDVNGEWLEIAFDGETGWVAFFVVTVTGSPDAVTVTETVPDATDPFDELATLNAATLEADEASPPVPAEQFLPRDETGGVGDVLSAASEAASEADPSLTAQPGQQTVITRFNTSLRTEPVFSAEAVVVVPFDVELPVEARTENRSWLRVTYQDTTGWLITSLVDVSTLNFEALPVVEIAP